MLGHTWNLGNQPIYEKITELWGLSVPSQAYGRNTLPFMLHFKLALKPWAGSGSWAVPTQGGPNDIESATGYWEPANPGYNF